MNLEKYIEIFTNLDINIIKLICEQNLDPNTTFEKLLEISENIDKQSFTDNPVSNIIEDLKINKIDNYLISPLNNEPSDNRSSFNEFKERDTFINNDISDNLSEDIFDNSDESSCLLSDNKNMSNDLENKKKCPCISLSSLYNVVVDNKQKVNYNRVESINDEDEYDKLFRL